MRKTLKQIRFESGMSQLEIWEKTRMSPSRISLIENGRMIPAPEDKQKLAMALGVAPEMILWPELRESVEKAG